MEYTCNRNKLQSTQPINNEPNLLGALIDFNINVTNKLQGDLIDRTHSVVQMWINFDEKSMLKIAEQIKLNVKAKDLGESVLLEYEIIELTTVNDKTVATTKLTVKFNQEATLHIDNLDVSKYVYLITATPSKTQRPD